MKRGAGAEVRGREVVPGTRRPALGTRRCRFCPSSGIRAWLTPRPCSQGRSRCGRWARRSRPGDRLARHLPSPPSPTKAERTWAGSSVATRAGVRLTDQREPSPGPPFPFGALAGRRWSACAVPLPMAARRGLCARGGEMRGFSVLTSACGDCDRDFFPGFSGSAHGMSRSVRTRGEVRAGHLRHGPVDLTANPGTRGAVHEPRGAQRKIARRRACDSRDAEAASSPRQEALAGTAREAF